TLTYQHRAGVRLYTSSCEFAESCVFDKQSVEPIYCGRLAPASLIANLRDHFAEFLNQCSPERLRLLISPTCVSFSTVSYASTLRSFSWTSFLRLPPKGRYQDLNYVGGFAYPPSRQGPRTFLFVRSHSGRRPSIGPHS